MAGKSGTFFKIIILSILIIALAFGGILWLTYLDFPLGDARAFMAPLFNKFPFLGKGPGRTGQDPLAGEILDIDAERIAVLVETIDLRSRELNNRQTDLDNYLEELKQIAQEQDERQKAIEDQEKSFNARVLSTEDKDRNIEQNARDLTNMPPERAVEILARMDDQDVIDVLLKTEQIAQAEGSSSIVPYWLSLMEPERAADISRKRANRPSSLN